MIVDRKSRDIRVGFEFKRSLTGFLLTTALPTIIANIIGHTTVFYDGHFDAAIGVNLTILLVITTI